MAGNYRDVVQAISRDIMACHMLDMREDIVMHTHDEIVWEYRTKSTATRKMWKNL